MRCGVKYLCLIYVDGYAVENTQCLHFAIENTTGTAMFAPYNWEMNNAFYYSL